MTDVDFGPLNTELANRTCVCSINLEPDASEYRFNLILELAAEPASLDRITVKFRDVADLKVDLPLGGWSQVHMLGIRSRGEGPRPYLVEEIEYQALSFRCRLAEII